MKQILAPMAFVWLVSSSIAHAQWWNPYLPTPEQTMKIIVPHSPADCAQIREVAEKQSCLALFTSAENGNAGAGNGKGRPPSKGNVNDLRGELPPRNYGDGTRPPVPRATTIAHVSPVRISPRIVVPVHLSPGHHSAPRHRTVHVHFGSHHHGHRHH